ncbi:helix-turn-helix domain-containing protein [Helicobacter pylori]|uniref:HTH domain protein n=1 Tax=Helicobacter pylori Hp P-4 TaxID=992075 RepID=J0Q0Y5_HELPX|nr:helix-turn-helix domain-containing protein [Helicobacter pylori]EJC04546.1 HTH domain protein [Helicobacter pylori Hp P-4]EJC22890.1 HTH domain protein [Helicobacter pylori Hp P-4d]EJC25113.1 HTH domain protein [Helicobacter pylori Hp P-4c]
MNYILKQPMKFGYTQISNDIFDDERVSDIAIAIYGYIKKHATTFKLCIEDIAKRFNRSAKTIHKYLNELKDLGYIDFERERKNDGTFSKFFRFIMGNFSKNPSEKQAKKQAEKASNHKQINVMWLKPQKEASNAHDSEAQSTSTYFPAFTLIKDQNKHENIRVSENFFNEEFTEKNQASTNAKDLKNFKNLVFKSSKIKNLSLFDRFSAFFSSILGNLDTKNLNQSERSAFEEFLNYRNEKHQLSYSTKKALLHQCEALKAQGCDLVACINQSIRRNYNEIYEVMHFEKPSYKNEAKQKDDEVMEQFNFNGANPKYNGLCIW